MDALKANWVKVAGVILLTIVVAFITVKLAVTKPQSQTTTVYDKVIKSGTLRACYAAYAPQFIKDPNTSKLSGVFFDVVSKAAENMSLKIDWNAEITRGEMAEALNSGRCDIVGSGFYATSARARAAELSIPVFYNPVYVYVRANDSRFDSDFKIANDKQYTVATVDGQSSQTIAINQFPNAKTLELPQASDASQLLLNVADGKADMTFSEPALANLYMKNNPGKIKEVSFGKPVQVYGNSVAIKKGEFALTSALNGAILELFNNGYVESVLTRYEKEYPGDYYRVALPYSTPAK
ncbi:MAG: transporter substrate-binding domain-containing protein [Candidatus Staskawiczbacteria bacterium]|nr:transporter substrate-binding domain-containing protein [Candidatus Staskawiczbacteria bacterium]